MKRILVTGASGFIGRQLCLVLARSGYAVRGAVRSIARTVMEVGSEDILRKTFNDVVEVGEIGPDTDWSEALQDVEAVVHLAGRAHVMKETVADPLALYRMVNVQGTRQLAKAATDAGIRRFVYISSVKVNGECSVLRPFREDDTPAPEDAYGISKYEAEEELLKRARPAALESVIVRAPLVYGPCVRGNFLRLLHCVRRGIPMPLASIRNQRSYVYVGNLVDALIRCVESPRASGETFLISDGEDLSTPELIRRISRAMGQPARLLPCAEWLLKAAAGLIGKGDVITRLCSSLTVDSSKARQLLGWKPPFSLTEGLQSTVNWFLNKGANKG